MITLIEGIEYSEVHNQWLLWFQDHSGKLDSIPFPNEEEAFYFKEKFQSLKNNLKTQQDKINFYEKTTLEELKEILYLTGECKELREKILKMKLKLKEKQSILKEIAVSKHGIYQCCYPHDCLYCNEPADYFLPFEILSMSKMIFNNKSLLFKIKFDLPLCNDCIQFFERTMNLGSQLKNFRKKSKDFKKLIPNLTIVL